ncbi:hypothetical protein SAMN05444166_3948 [Singulisphaera sp. GP187]|uniref:hypothetical protein n=1 Tax=Singulisphaera sp. GP187 TaxID=1882752 RepID=UPI000927E6EE|nr:hypothetical protein [Singulisphaera sp. GP187]SIO34422.1 hypothetical protein SAMN05444166_3948 [Singulisphaera sp. GP187]
MADKLPEPTWKDHAHLAARAAISAVPLVGGPALELFNAVIAPPLQNRRDEWVQQMADRLVELEAAGFLKVEDLGTNEEFISTVTQASTIAIRNHRKEKLEALRNAVLNTAAGRSPGDTKREMFLNLVDAFTVDHIRILKTLYEHQRSLKRDEFWTDSVQGLANIALERVPELPKEDAVPKIIVSDLCRRELLNWHGETSGPSFQQRDLPIVVPFAQQFLQFIEAPKPPK